ncbi:hypothetical protein [Desulfuromonas sp.]|uniref:hypothetical protein n=1 Tax=Desulfuromonas sp. TaxID=892 RepID=UPI0025BCD379|nr:hypothetical protein [Desulfuromonas sp.]
MEVGLKLTPPVAAALDSLLEGILGEVAGWGLAPRPATGRRSSRDRSVRFPFFAG